MRALPPLSVTVSRHQAWNAGVCAGAVLALGSVAAWGHAWRDVLGAAELAGLSLLVLATAWAVVGLWRRGATTLCWDGAQWQLGVGDPPRWCDCEPAVALDLGNWLLLRCRVLAGAGARRRKVWLPVGRPGLEDSWHALRCTVHAARPGARSAQGAEP